MILKILLWINISLLYAHELDAVRKREWKMMAFANMVSDETAYRIFTALHVPLFASVFWLAESRFNMTYWAFSCFGVFHFILHSAFRKHIENRMRNVFSRSIIVMIFLVSLMSIILGLALVNQPAGPAQAGPPPCEIIETAK